MCIYSSNPYYLILPTAGSLQRLLTPDAQESAIPTDVVAVTAADQESDDTTQPTMSPISITIKQGIVIPGNIL